MKIETVKSNKGNFISDIYIIKPKIFNDSRGYFYESWNKNLFNKLTSKTIDFCQDNHSYSWHGVLRGLHYQINPNPQGKLVRCLNGEIFDVAIDLRSKSKTFGEWAGTFISDCNKKQFWIPEGFAHGFLTISKSAEVLYKTTSLWNKVSERSIIWNDSKLSIQWPLNKLKISSPLLSNKDEHAPSFNEAIFNSDIFL